MQLSDWLALGALVVAVYSLVHAHKSNNSNSRAAGAAQATADAANELATRANGIAQEAVLALQEGAELQSRPYLSFTREQHSGTWIGCIKNTGSAVAADIELTAFVTDDTPSDQKSAVKQIVNNLMEKYRGISMGPGDWDDVCSLYQQLQYVGVTSLAYKNSEGKQYWYTGRATELREDTRKG